MTGLVGGVATRGRGDRRGSELMEGQWDGVCVLGEQGVGFLSWIRQRQLRMAPRIIRYPRLLDHRTTDPDEPQVVANHSTTVQDSEPDECGF